MVEVDVTGLVQVRESMKDKFQETEGVALTYLPFIVEIVAKCLKTHHIVNSSWDHDTIILKDNVNIGIAVATSEGLLVPVIQEADALEVPDIAKLIARLTRNAQERSLSVTEVQGATFTVNNTGVLGSVIGKAIINYPQAAILNTEAIVKRPIVKDEEIVIRSMMNLCLTFDHRILDGSDVSRFLSDIKDKLEMITLSTKKVQES
jgi:2-oxoisovalerate dehydrogenase E2 component (dihydrolipoyl transacylase)